MKKNTSAVSGLNIHNLNKEELMEAMDWRELSGACIPTFNRKGLQMLVEGAMEIYKEKASRLNKRSWGYLPWNLAGAGAPWYNLPSHKNFFIKGGVESWASKKGYEDQITRRGNIVEYAARFSGWLKVAGDMEGIIQSIRHNVGSGMFSPYTVVNPFRLFEKWNSPQKLERQIWKVRQRADQILEPYGLSASWSALGQTMVAHREVGKSALWAAEETVRRYLEYYDFRFENQSKRELGQGRFFYLQLARGLKEMKNHPDAVQRWAVSRCFDGEFQSLREALAASGRLQLDITDGVRLIVDPSTSIVIHGVKVTIGWVNIPSGFGDNGRQYLLRQEKTNRTFHSYYYGNQKYAVKEAIGAWRRQVALEKQEADLVAFLRGDSGFCPLVYRQSSYDAGNCTRGTYAWLKGRGWEEKQFIPGAWLVPHLDESRVRNTAMALYKSFSEN